MLSQLRQLTSDTDGRYASDEELQFLSDYILSFSLRMQTYHTLQSAETTIVQQVEETLRSRNPEFFHRGSDDITVKWRRDTVRVLRYSAVAMLIDDPETLRERFLYWFQTIMKAFSAQKSCNMTYAVMQEVVKQKLPPVQASLFCPILEINRQILSKGQNA